MKFLISIAIVMFLALPALPCHAIEVFNKTAYEQFYRMHDFSSWLITNETILTASIEAYDTKAPTINLASTLISDVSLSENVRVIYRAKAGSNGKLYLLRLKITTSLTNQFEDKLYMRIVD